MTAIPDYEEQYIAGSIVPLPLQAATCDGILTESLTTESTDS
jgi:hypothetical protein